MYRRSVLSCLFILMLCHAALANATMVRVCSLVLPPQTMLNEQGAPDGYATRILQEVAAKLNWTLEISYLPWLRVVEDAKSGRCDIVYTVLRRNDYEKFLIFPKYPVLNQVNVLIVRKDRNIRYDGDLEAFMHKYSIGLYRDKAVDDRFEILRNSPWARIDTADTPSRNIAKLIAGRFDAAIENDLTAIYELRQLHQTNAVEILQHPLNVTPAYIVFPKAGRLAESVNQFDAEMEKYMKTKSYQSLSKQYLELK